MKLKNILEYEYSGKLSHQPSDPDEYDIPRGDNILTHDMSPPDLYKNSRNYLFADNVSKDELRKFMDFIKLNQGNPNAKIKIYRGQPSDALHSGMWVTPFKSYATSYAYGNEYSGKGSKVYEFTVKLHDISCDLDSLAEWGYFGKTVVGKEL